MKEAEAMAKSFESMQAYASQQSYQWFYLLDKNDGLLMHLAPAGL